MLGRSLLRPSVSFSFALRPTLVSVPFPSDAPAFAPMSRVGRPGFNMFRPVHGSPRHLSARSLLFFRRADLSATRTRNSARLEKSWKRVFDRYSETIRVEKKRVCNLCMKLLMDPALQRARNRRCCDCIKISILNLHFFFLFCKFYYRISDR